MESEERHALLIAARFSPRISEHPCFRIRDGYHKLSSDRDVDLMQELLVDRFDFPNNNIRVLNTEEASQEAILDAVEELVGRVGRDDVVVIYYSGHGSRMRDPNNQDGMCETIVPYDSGRAEGKDWECALKEERPCNLVWSLDEVPDWVGSCGPREGRGPRRSEENRDIPDLEINRWVQELNKKTGHVTLIFDCCHSGSVTRDPDGKVREAVADHRPASEMFEGGGLPPIFVGPSDPEGDRIRSGWLSVERRAVMVASCRAPEVSWERRHSAHGLLTYHLHSALRDLGPEATWKDVFERVAPQVSAERPTQHPQVEGEIDLQVFGRKKVRTSSYLPVVVVDRETVELWGGAAHGVSPDSLWTIRPHGTRNRHGGEELVRVRIERVRPVTSRGRREEGAAAGELAPGQRAFLLEQTLPPPGLQVAIAAPDERRGRLVERLRSSQLLAVVEPPAVEEDGEEPGPGDGEPLRGEDVVAHCLAPRDPVGPGDPWPFLGPLREWTWAAVDAAGQLQVRLRTDDDDGVEGLTQDLVKMARFQGLERLSNPDPESRLRERLDLRILHRPEPKQSPEPANTDEEDGLMVVEEGDKVDFEIENRHDEQVWVSLVELDSDHSITVLMPARGHPRFRPGGQLLAPGQVLRLGRDYYGLGDGLQQVLPDGFPWCKAEDESQVVGVSSFKLLATSVPADFEFLEQEDTRFVPSHPLQEVAWLYHSSFGTRTVVLPPEDVAHDEDWTVVTRRLGIRRRQES
ncbi:MAG: caspase family protein [bacterium]|nr:caspase family protein [bacterium]